MKYSEMENAALEIIRSGARWCELDYSQRNQVCRWFNERNYRAEIIDIICQHGSSRDAVTL